MNKIYCTYFDRNYITQGIAMITSLREFDRDNIIFVLALDPETKIILTKKCLNNIVIVNLEEIESTFPDLKSAKSNRSKIEYYFTLTPAIIKFVLDQNQAKNLLVIYLDADLYFFNNPEETISEISQSSVGIIPHRYGKLINKRMKPFGIYNVGMVLFKSDTDGLRVLNWWFNSCIEWCYDLVEDGKFADQKYLERFFDYSERIRVIENIGANVAPWNVSNYFVHLKKSQIYINDAKLVFFHFHNLKIIFNRFLIPHIYYRSRLTNNTLNLIYKPYTKRLIEISTEIGITLNSGFSVFNRSASILKRIIKILSIVLIIIFRHYIKLEKSPLTYE